MRICMHLQHARLAFAFALVLQAVLQVRQVSCMILAFSTIYCQFLSHLQLYQHHPNDMATTTCPILNDDSNGCPHPTTMTVATTRKINVEPPPPSLTLHDNPIGDGYRYSQRQHQV